MQLRILTAADIKLALPMTDAIGVMRQAFLAFEQQKINMPPRHIIDITPSQTTKTETALAAFMPAYFVNTGDLGIKIASLMPANLKNYNLPLIHALVILLDITTGQPQALLDGAMITALKTGATSGLATDLLALNKIDTAAIIGAGVQARAQLQAICCVRKIGHIKFYSRTLANAQQFATEFLQQKDHTIKVTVCQTLKEAVANAQIICTATTSKTPIIDIKDVMPGVHINAVGGHTLTTREVSAALIAQAKIVVEQREATFKESCERNVIELGRVLVSHEDRRNTPSQITLFASVGTAMQDVAIAAAVWKQAKEKNLGTVINL